MYHLKRIKNSQEKFKSFGSTKTEIQYKLKVFIRVWAGTAGLSLYRPGTLWLNKIWIVFHWNRKLRKRNSETPYRPYYNPSFRVGKNTIAFNFKLHSFKARKITSIALGVEDFKLIFLLTVSYYKLAVPFKSHSLALVKSTWSLVSWTWTFVRIVMYSWDINIGWHYRHKQ